MTLAAPSRNPDAPKQRVFADDRPATDIELGKSDRAQPRCTPTLNALTIDLEDWAQSTLGHQMPITDRVVRNTDRVLGVLSDHGVRATFFALGKVCEKFPQLLENIASAGHEIASHGWGHQLVSTLTPTQFEADVSRGVAVIESQIGRRPIGYRAPAFSITRECDWVGPVLCRLGFKYSSSIFPIAGKRYGIAGANRFVHRWNNCNLIEFPLSTIRRFNRNFPMSGGGYLRLLPRRIVAGAIRELNREGHPAVIYMHPYEMDVREIAELKRAGWSIHWKTHLHQSLFRGRFCARLKALLSEFRFAPMAEVLGLV